MQYSAFLVVCLGLVLGIFSCAPSPDQPTDERLSARHIVDRSIAAHGMENFSQTDASFTFREREYGIRRRGGRYTYTRSFTDSLGQAVRDVLDNGGLRRYRNDSLITLASKDSAAYASSVNSVQYFFSLPYGLRDPAVNLELLDTASLDGRVYDRVRVSFSREGGGTDFDDVYHYFFDRQSGEMDYLAYTFEADEGGIRFRRAINKRREGGVLIQDYVNYGVDGDDRNIAAIARRYAAGELPELSRIENTAVRIEQAGGQ